MKARAHSLARVYQLHDDAWKSLPRSAIGTKRGRRKRTHNFQLKAFERMSFTFEFIWLDCVPLGCCVTETHYATRPFAIACGGVRFA